MSSNANAVFTFVLLYSTVESKDVKTKEQSGRVAYNFPDSIFRVNPSKLSDVSFGYSNIMMTLVLHGADTKSLTADSAGTEIHLQQTDDDIDYPQLAVGN